MNIYICKSFRGNNLTAWTRGSLLEKFKVNARQGKKDQPIRNGLHATEITRLDYSNIVKSNMFHIVNDMRQL